MFAQNIDRGFALEPPLKSTMFWSKNKNNMYTPSYTSFTTYKWGSRKYTLHGYDFLMIRLICGFTKYRGIVKNEVNEQMSKTKYAISAQRLW